jgi:hypothetical protein
MISRIMIVTHSSSQLLLLMTGRGCQRRYGPSYSFEIAENERQEIILKAHHLTIRTGVDNLTHL